MLPYEHKQRPRIMIAAHSGQQGGAELCLDILLQHLPAERYCIDLLFGCEGPMVQSAATKGRKVDVVPFVWWLGYESSAWYWRNLLKAPFRIIRLVRRLRREGHDLVYTNSAVIFEAALAARMARLPHIWHVHEILRPHSWRSWLPTGAVCRLIDRWSDVIIFESHNAREIFAKLHLPQTKTEVIHNPSRFLLDEKAIPKSPTLRRSLGIPEEAFVVLWVGQFIPRKNPQLAIAGLERTENDRSVLLLVGDGPLRPTVEANLPPAIRPRVRFLGFQEDVAPIIMASDVLLLTSVEESFGLVLVEAAACGKPAVATACGGPEEIIVHGETGYIVPRDDPEAIGRALTILGSQPELVSLLGQQARDWVSERFHPQSFANRISSVFDGILQKNPSSW
ncbi:MAG: glycosyltransferase family 4 protein [Thermogutta sp.]